MSFRQSPAYPSSNRSLTLTPSAAAMVARVSRRHWRICGPRANMFPGAYVEHSPSGTGLHILGRGDIQIKGRNRRDLGLEVYTRERFFTVTGQAFYPDRLDLADCAEPFRAFLTEFFPDLTTPPLPATSEQPQSTTRSILPDDLALVEKAKAASNGISFSSLWSGDWSGFPSQSEADLALCNALAFWTGRDADRMPAMISSALAVISASVNDRAPGARGLKSIRNVPSASRSKATTSRVNWWLVPIRRRRLRGPLARMRSASFQAREKVIETR